MWLKVEGFKDLLKTWWESDNFNGFASFILAKKLKVVKSKLKEWNRDVLARWITGRIWPWISCDFRMQRRRLTDCLWKRWMLEDKREKNTKNGVLLEENLDVNALEVPFTEEEVHGALVGCSGDKAPRPDGFIMAFWQFAWDFVKEEVEAEDLRDFRPISLVGKPVQVGRQILDAVLITNEAIDSVMKKNENGIMCKLDIEKAYDNVDWSFLLTVMQKMGFGDKWIEWIKWCISTTSFSMMDNEVFSSFLKRATDGGFMSGSDLPKLVTHVFEVVLGLRINLEKSELIPIGRVENIEDFSLDFDCRVGSLPSTYLGLSLGAPFKLVSMGMEWKSASEVREAHDMGLWKGIRMDWELVGTRISFSVGNGRRVRFWRDRWCGIPLCVSSFPSLFALSIEKEAWVADVWDPLAERVGR
ncbi:hypothetical protein CK203_109627 [Vitis vinifera]|uniref:Uncharacterized protein n=1 Tax=Vitis vinifera TaxID=29760 RepID=A0A438EAM6_VITVI|nr:hypothetical protein CK203_109627 [Vitis vinifera]